MLVDLVLLTYLLVAGALRRNRDRLHLDERGEGVISAAIAVLIMAFLGAGMWVAFKAIFDKTSDNTDKQVDQIGKG